MITTLSLKEAQRRILSMTSPGEQETLPLPAVLGRICAHSTGAVIPVPSFNHSTRDGFAVRSRDLRKAAPDRPLLLPVVGMIAAGRLDPPPCPKGSAIRIMTGAAIPPGADQVIPFEEVIECNQGITSRNPGRPGRFIRKRGSDLNLNRIIIKDGESIQPDHLALLATAGVEELTIYQKPSVAILTTGSELIRPGQEPRPGEVISSNGYLLGGLIKSDGGKLTTLSSAGDNEALILAKLDTILAGQPRIIISTGGMGPGDYDLMGTVLDQLGVTKVYQDLAVRPGRATIFGHRKSTLFFALPGPPPAVRLLYNELIRPALRKIGGSRQTAPAWHARLNTSINNLRPGIMKLMGGVHSQNNDGLTVRPAEKIEPITCVMVIPANRRSLKAGERITIHPAMGAGLAER